MHSAAAGEQACETLLGFVKSSQHAERLPSGDLRRMALLAWTMVHGIAKLAISGRLPFRSKAEVLKFREFVIDRIVAGQPITVRGTPSTAVMPTRRYEVPIHRLSPNLCNICRKRGSTRKAASLGSTLTNGASAERSSLALVSQPRASSFFPRPM